jgi:chromosome segregation ATPase
MRPTSFSEESIIQAGEELRAQGRAVTGFALRKQLGGGNFTRLRQVWDEHVANQSVLKAEPVAELPVEVAQELATVTKALVERLTAMAVELNDKAVKASERRVTEVVRSAGEQRAQTERELADAAQTVEDLEARLDEATAHMAAQAEKLAEVQASAQAQALELAQLKERLASEKAQAIAQAQAAGEHITQAQAAQAQALEEVTTSRQAASTAREEAAELRGQVASLTTQVKELMEVFAAR